MRQASQGAVDGVPTPHTPGSEIMPDAPPAVVLATLHERHGGHGAASLRPSSVHQAGQRSSTFLSSAPRCKLLEGWDVFTSVSLPVDGHGIHIPAYRTHVGTERRTLVGESH